MKKLSALVFAASLIALFFISCNKEGVYKPKEKISKIYYEHSYKVYSGGELVSENSSTKSLEEIWHWKGKKLTQIENGDWPLNFVYKGNQLEKIESGEMVIEFTYDKSLLEKIEVIYDDKTQISIKIDARNDKKITRMTYQYYDYDELKSLKDNDITNNSIAISPNKIESIMALVLPNDFSKFLAKNLAKKKRKATEVETHIIELTYDGNNITEQKWTDEDGDSETYVFTYDNKKNPYYKSFHNVSEDGVFIQSENNIVTMYDKHDSEDITKYEYKYNGDFPTQRIERYSYGDDDWYRYEYSNIYYYEYE